MTYGCERPKQSEGAAADPSIGIGERVVDPRALLNGWLSSSLGSSGLSHRHWKDWLVEVRMRMRTGSLSRPKYSSSDHDGRFFSVDWMTPFLAVRRSCIINSSLLLPLLPSFLPFLSFPSLPLYISAYSYPIMHHFGLLGVMDKGAERTNSQRPGRGLLWGNRAIRNPTGKSVNLVTNWSRCNTCHCCGRFGP